MPSEASYSHRAAAFQVDYDADATFEDEVHGIGGRALMRDDIACTELEALALRGKQLRVFGVA